MGWLVAPRLLLAPVGVPIVAIVFVNLGFWQLRRLEERRLANTVGESRFEAEPVDIATLIDSAGDDHRLSGNRGHGGAHGRGTDGIDQRRLRFRTETRKGRKRRRAARLQRQGADARAAERPLEVGNGFIEQRALARPGRPRLGDHLGAGATRDPDAGRFGR